MNEATGSDTQNSQGTAVLEGAPETSMQRVAGDRGHYSRMKPDVLENTNVSGGPYAPSLATSGTRSTGSTHIPSQRSRRPASVPRAIPSNVKHACHALFAACIDRLDRALNHDDDFFARNNALEQLREALADLWSRRAQREDAFAEIVNMLQGVFIQRKVEEFSAEQLEKLRAVFEKLQTQTEFDDDFANSITLELLNGGIDAFREIE